MIKPIKDLKKENSIDLSGPQGNVFYLIGTARTLARQLDLDPDKISEEMKSGDYENAVQTFEKYFRDYITLYR